MDCLYQANFMLDHRLACIQAVCLLNQVAHHLNQSDKICVLIAATIRIAQCLNFHRLGPDRAGNAWPSSNTSILRQDLVEREVKKRVWWYLLRQDWLQIPFENTCQIHPTQFNTPMPLNCFDEVDRMVVQPASVYTQNSYTHSLNQGMRTSLLMLKEHLYMLTNVGLELPSLCGSIKIACARLDSRATWTRV